MCRDCYSCHVSFTLPHWQGDSVFQKKNATGWTLVFIYPLVTLEKHTTDSRTSDEAFCGFAVFFSKIKAL